MNELCVNIKQVAENVKHQRHSLRPSFEQFQGIFHIFMQMVPLELCNLMVPVCFDFSLCDSPACHLCVCVLSLSQIMNIFSVKICIYFFRH